MRKRVHYRERQSLHAEDLRDEQAYRISMRRRHNIGHHGWGVVTGLKLIQRSGNVVLEPGFAVDAYGRELLVPEPIILQGEQLAGLAGNEEGTSAQKNDEWAIDVWLSYRLLGNTQGAQHHDRICLRAREEAWLTLCRVRSDYRFDPYHPPGVDRDDDPFMPYQEPPDDPAKVWPVHLGRIFPSNSKDGGDYGITKNPPYASLVGSMIDAPWGGNWLTLEPKPNNVGTYFDLSLADERGGKQTKLSIDHAGAIRFNGGLNLTPLTSAEPSTSERVTLSSQTDNTAQTHALHIDAMKNEPKVASPWSFYRITPAEQPADASQLRVELAHPGEEGDPARNELCIGSSSASQFQPSLRIRADNTVVIEGNLTIISQLVEGAIDVDATDTRFREALLSRWTKGLVSAGTEVDAFYTTKLKIEFVNLTPPPGSTISTELKVTNEAEPDPEQLPIPILRVELEIRNQLRQVVAHIVQRLQPDDPNSSIAAGHDATYTGPLPGGFSFTPLLPGGYTLTARVVSLGAAQNQIETTESRVVHIS